MFKSKSARQDERLGRNWTGNGGGGGVGGGNLSDTYERGFTQQLTASD